MGLHLIHPVAEFGKFLLHLGEMLTGGGIVALLFEGRLFDFVLNDLAGDLIDFGRHRVDLGAEHRAGLIYKIDRLVRQKTVGDIAVGESCGGDQRLIGDPHPMKDLIPLLESPQDGDGILDRGRIDHHRLEPPLQGGILLDIEPVFIESGRADAVKFSAGEHRLQKVARIHRAFGFARAHDGVQLIDEEDNASVRSLDFVEHRLEPFFKFAAVLCTRDQRTHIEGEDSFVAQPFGHISPDDPLCEALGDGRLTDARLADQAGVVLAFAGKDPDHIADFLVTSDHRIELVFPRPLDKVRAVFFECLVGRLRIVAGDPCVAAHSGQSLQHRVGGDLKLLEELAEIGIRLFGQSDKDVFDRQVFIPETLGVGFGPVEGAVDVL